KNKRRPVWNLDDFLYGAITEGFVAHNVAPCVLKDSRGYDFSWTRRPAIYQHHQREVGDRLLRVGIEGFARILLPLQVSDRSVAQKEVCSGDPFRLLAFCRISQIKDQFLGA